MVDFTAEGTARSHAIASAKARFTQSRPTLLNPHIAAIVLDTTPSRLSQT